MANCVANPGSLRTLAAGIASGELTSTQLVERYLERIAAVQPMAEPWRMIDSERALAVAEIRDSQIARGEILGPLHGIPFGVKDIIDVAGIATRCNCKAYEDRPPAVADAEVVLGLKAAGAIVLGKLHTTEFAYFDPSPARNPHNTDHTPGGSSSGSAAAVASGTVPFALGTQTVASVNRPAAYCGIAAFKPSTRSLSGHGVNPLAPSYDTVGFYGWSVDDALYAYEATRTFAMGSKHDEAVQKTAPHRIVFLEDELLSDMTPAMGRAVREHLDRFSDAGHCVERIAPPVSFTQLNELHMRTMTYEAARVLACIKQYSDEIVGPRVRTLVSDGAAITEENYLEARAQINALRGSFFSAFGPRDLFFWPAAPGPAPRGIQSTGDPKYIAPWTSLGGPIVTMPIGENADGLPLGSILSARPFADRSVAAAARDLNKVD